MSGSEEVRFHRTSQIEGLELAAARYRSRAFPQHLHEEFVIGTMTSGAERLTIRGCDRIVRPGSLILIEPGEPHANAGFGDNLFAYEVFYVPASVMASFVGDALGGQSSDPVRVDDPVPDAPDLCLTLRRTHRLLMARETRLCEESALASLLSALLNRGHLLQSRLRADVGQRAVRDARDHIEAHFRDPISLRDLSALTGTSAYHLLRMFKHHLGLPPAAYQIQLKVAEAKRLLRAGSAIADAAAEVGFADQSHLTRHFRRIVGTTPGHYAAH